MTRGELVALYAMRDAPDEAVILVQDGATLVGVALVELKVMPSGRTAVVLHVGPQ